MIGVQGFGVQDFASGNPAFRHPAHAHFAFGAALDYRPMPERPGRVRAP